MLLSQYFMPTLKETPSDAQIASHRLMLRAGMIYQTSAGIYGWLPMATRVLENIQRIVREEQDRAGAQEVILPTIQSADLWKQSGRYDAYGQEMLRFKDRHEREILYTPTAEEAITDIAAHHIKSYRDLPKLLYQIQWKFRDEIRPRFGVMRGREFLMKDCYSFDIDYEGALRSYQLMLEAYIKSFIRMGLTAIPVKADPGAIGGNLSQEFHVLASTGESLIYYDQKLDTLLQDPKNIDVDQLMNIYAAEETLHNPKECAVPEAQLKQARGIEVGHIFYFGTKYSEAFNMKVSGPTGNMIIPHMGSYGIGISRLVGAIIEANHDDAGIIWPEGVAPFKVGLISIRTDDEATTKTCRHLYETLQNQGISVLYDDREERPGAKFATMDLMGAPWQLRVGPKGLEKGLIELKNRRTGETQELSIDSALSYLMQQLSH
ncbi:MAG: proline--tRNA ligase [Caedibacter sp. 38-128]|nr:proline--tRNA ligase [Holosporales bacterium]OJX08024.1 MAG: proline--tRNA ligase [Caedibacter sp. 38-128]